MKTVVNVIAFLCFFVSAGIAQPSTAQPDFSVTRLHIRLLQPPQQVNAGSAVNSGNPGNATYYYWVVSTFAAGPTQPSGPFIITNAPSTLSSGNGVTVSWNAANGASTYDVLRTSTAAMPTGACNCAVAASVSGNNVTDQSNTLNAYTVSAAVDPNSFAFTITNEVCQGTVLTCSGFNGVPQLTFRVNGVSVGSISSSGLSVPIVQLPSSGEIHFGTSSVTVLCKFIAAGSFQVGANGCNSNGTIFAAGATIGSSGISVNGSGALTGVSGSGSNIVTDAAPTLNRFTVNTGVSQGSGIKHQRFGASCTTAASVGAACNSSYSWTSAFADSNYTVSCTGDGRGGTTSGVPTVINVNTIAAGSFNVSIGALTAAAAQFPTIDCIAIHD